MNPVGNYELATYVNLRQELLFYNFCICCSILPVSAVGFPTLVSQNNKLTRFADLHALPSKFIFLKR